MALSKRLINKLASAAGSSEKLFDGAGTGDILKDSQSKDHKGGRKFDGGKLQYGLIPPLALRETVKVLTYGAEKYEPDNWRRVPDGPRRYFDAAQRHLWAYKKGELNDEETGINHLAHAICCLMFMLDLDESEYEE
jgi:hypothetical protein